MWSKFTCNSPYKNDYLTNLLLKTLVDWISNCAFFGDVKTKNSNLVTLECHLNLHAFFHIEMTIVHWSNQSNTIDIHNNLV